MERIAVLPPCVLHEDEHLLVIEKPAGWNTHSPAPYAGEGLYEWLRHREPRWAGLSILHRLDKETSGVIVFGKSSEANRSLTGQFSSRAVSKRYRLWVSHRPLKDDWISTSTLARAGDRYVSRPTCVGADSAETAFRVLGPVGMESGGFWELEAVPHTGRTHQIRVHAADSGCPIVGDVPYGGTPFRRVCLHAAEIEFTHPTGSPVCRYRSPPNFAAEPRAQLRAAFIDPIATNAFRSLHGAADGVPGSYLDQLGDFTLLQTLNTASIPSPITSWPNLYQKLLRRDVRRTTSTESAPRFIHGRVAPDSFLVRENGVHFELRLTEGYSVGLFLDQRDNRRRLLAGYVGAEFPLRLHHADLGGATVLNAFAYTCGFSLCAALGGAQTTSLDLSRKYLDWGRRNFVHNGLDPAAHEFIHGDCFDWMRRLAKKDRTFDLVLLDPPTFSRSKEQGDFRAEHDYGRLVQAALPLLKSGGVLFASTNALRLPPEMFLAQIRTAVTSAGRRVLQELYVPQPPDFPITRDEPAHLKTIWLRIK